MGHLLAVLVGEGELVALLPDTDHVPVVVDRQRLADEPLVVDVVVAVAAQFDDLVAVEREGEIGLPAEIRLADILRMERQLDTLVAGLSDVVENLAVTVHDRHRARHQQIVRIGKIHVDRTAQASVEKLEVDTEVGRIGRLPLQVGVADAIARQIGRVGGAAAVAPNVLDAVGCVKTVERLVARNGVVAVSAVRQADFQHVDPRSVVLDETLFAQMPGYGGRREEGPFVIFGESRERVGASGQRQQILAVESVVHAEHARNEIFLPIGRTDSDLVFGAVHPVEARIVVHEALAALRSARILGFLHGEQSREVDVVLFEIAVEFQHVLPRPVRRVVVIQFGAAVHLLTGHGVAAVVGAVQLAAVVVAELRAEREPLDGKFDVEKTVGHEVAARAFLIGVDILHRVGQVRIVHRLLVIAARLVLVDAPRALLDGVFEVRRRTAALAVDELRGEAHRQPVVHRLVDAGVNGRTLIIRVVDDAGIVQVGNGGHVGRLFAAALEAQLVVHREDRAENIVLPVVGDAFGVVDLLAGADDRTHQRIELLAAVIVFEPAHVLFETDELVGTHRLDALHRFGDGEFRLVGHMETAFRSALGLDQDDAVRSA